jgi:hypothetical protein
VLDTGVLRTLALHPRSTDDVEARLDAAAAR